jgi:hypothetical protein
MTAGFVLFTGPIPEGLYCLLKGSSFHFSTGRDAEISVVVFLFAVSTVNLEAIWMGAGSKCSC